MPPTSSRDFLRIAVQRLEAAEEILRVLPFTLEAAYIGGYAVECSLKALILERTAPADRPAMLERPTRGAVHHRADVLLDRLRELGIRLTTELAARMRKFDWNVNWRYETGRKDSGETRAMLRTARMVCAWVKEQL